MRTLSHENYTIGWICATSTELTAAKAMLDEKHALLPLHPLDRNSYTLGCIAGHNVVIACLPLGQLGTTSAAIVASDMAHSFTYLKFGLMVGIGGGVPSGKRDIRLGDVVVSKPRGTNGGVVQYDFGRTMRDGSFRQTGTLNAPPMTLLTALNNLKSKHETERFHCEVPDSLKPYNYGYPGAEKDKLFVASYAHENNNPTCDACANDKLQLRPQRPSSNPYIHYGTIASGNQLMTHGPTRDKLQKDFDMLCFEMEAAGLMNHFPCVVIRGISDYSDSHKQGLHWQPYAAFTAAAYAKELLGIIPSQQVATTPSYVAHCDSGDQSFVRFTQLRHFTSVALGRLVNNPQAPWEDFCPCPLDLAPTDFGISPQRWLWELMRRATGPHYTRLISLLSSMLGSEGPLGVAQAINSSTETTYVLNNSGNVFRKYCRLPEARSWLENTVQYSKKVYMVVGLHTLKLPATMMSVTGEELIVAVEYRKVAFRWYWRQNVDSAYLNSGTNIWEVFVISRSDDEDEAHEFEIEEENIVEAILEDNISQDEMEALVGEACSLDGQLIVM
jgi:nucleoside phosphorylase